MGTIRIIDTQQKQQEEEKRRQTEAWEKATLQSRVARWLIESGYGWSHGAISRDFSAIFSLEDTNPAMNEQEIGIIAPGCFLFFFRDSWYCSGVIHFPSAPITSLRIEAFGRKGLQQIQGIVDALGKNCPHLDITVEIVDKRPNYLQSSNDGATG